MSRIQITVDEINKLEPHAIIDNDLVREKFISIYDAMWSTTTGMSGVAAYEKESRYFKRILSEKEDIRKNCTKFSIFTAFLDVAINGLSLEPGTRAQSYLQSRSIEVGTYYENGQKKKQYETQAILTVSGCGELILRARSGQIRHADNPVIVYTEDEFEYGERNGQKFVNFTCRLPHSSGQIVACFMKITRADGSIDYSVMLPEDWMRLAGYSARQNRKWDERARQWVQGNPNALYGYNGQTCNIDTGFLIAKCIKHAFKSYPKARVGRGTQLESQQVDEFEVNDDLYGLENGATVDPSTGEYTPPMQEEFTPAADTSAGVTINPETTADNGADDIF